MFEKLPKETGVITIKSKVNMDFLDELDEDFFITQASFNLNEYNISHSAIGIAIEPRDHKKRKIFIPWHNIEYVTGDILQNDE